MCQLEQSHESVSEFVQMNKRPGERQAQRMKTAIETAFHELLRERSYEDLSVSEIAERANVGRSTFYRYYETKTDLLIAIHERLFERLNLGMTERAQWLGDAPPPGLAEFLAQMRRMDARNPAYYTLSKDLSFSREMTLIMRRITLLLRRQVEAGLSEAFASQQPQMPLPMLAETVVSIYTALLNWWLTQQDDLSAEQTAAHLHRLIRAVVRDAYLLDGV